ncbi:MAG: glycosyltransferase [Planctomycetota bacterium]|jgi:glycosyltransferase involved in cell wall biosynthesis
MKIAITGIRGIPANYGGFETFVEELAPRLAARGHRVTVYGRSNNIKYRKKYYRGVRICILPTVPHKYFDTAAHTLFTLFCIIPRDYDAVLVCNAINSVYCLPMRMAGKRVCLNVDGLDRLRKKWNWIGRFMGLIGEAIALFAPDEIITDAEVVEKYYLDRYGAKSAMIPYGVSTERAQRVDALEKLELEPDDYILYVSRLEPENNAHIVIAAFEKLETDMKLVVVGDAPYSSDYIKKLKSTDDRRIIFPGAIYGEGYRELQSHSFAYVQATEVGGTHPALLEGMALGSIVLANDTPEHREVLGDGGLYFEKNNAEALTKVLTRVIGKPDIRKEYREAALNRVRENYSWEVVTDAYESLLSGKSH